MADLASAASNGDGVAFLVSAGIVYEIVAAACSSPQTTEINAGARSKTLMKWVYLGLGQAAVIVALAVSFDRKHTVAMVVGGAIAGILMYISYVYARRCGLGSSEPGTESY
jgi:bacteriorhodopsin